MPDKYKETKKKTEMSQKRSLQRLESTKEPQGEANIEFSVCSVRSSSVDSFINPNLLHSVVDVGNKNVGKM